MKKLTQEEAREILQEMDIALLDLIERAKQAGIDQGGRFAHYLREAEWSVSQARTRARELSKGDSDVK